MSFLKELTATVRAQKREGLKIYHINRLKSTNAPFSHKNAYCPDKKHYLIQKQNKFNILSLSVLDKFPLRVHTFLFKLTIFYKRLSSMKKP